MKSYDTVYKGGTAEIVEKKSRFIAQVFPITTEDEAAQILEATRKRYWDARHNCYAFSLGAKGETTRCSDDREPSGTAGRPILEVITGRALRNVLVVVTRYFGGTLLGTGGLVRAYGRAAQAGMEASCIITKQYGFRVTVETDYNGMGKLQYAAAQLGVIVEDIVYTEAVQMKLLVQAELWERLYREMTEATAGQAVITKEDTPLFFAEADGKIVVFDA